MAMFNPYLQAIRKQFLEKKEAAQKQRNPGGKRCSWRGCQYFESSASSPCGLRCKLQVLEREDRVQRDRGKWNKQDTQKSPRTSTSDKKLPGAGTNSARGTRHSTKSTRVTSSTARRKGSREPPAGDTPNDIDRHGINLELGTAAERQRKLDRLAPLLKATPLAPGTSGVRSSPTRRPLLSTAESEAAGVNALPKDVLFCVLNFFDIPELIYACAPVSKRFRDVVLRELASVETLDVFVNRSLHLAPPGKTRELFWVSRHPTFVPFHVTGWYLQMHRPRQVKRCLQVASHNCTKLRDLTVHSNAPHPVWSLAIHDVPIARARTIEALKRFSLETVREVFRRKNVLKQIAMENKRVRSRKEKTHVSCALPREAATLGLESLAEVAEFHTLVITRCRPASSVFDIVPAGCTLRVLFLDLSAHRGSTVSPSDHFFGLLQRCPNLQSLSLSFCDNTDISGTARAGARRKVVQGLGQKLEHLELISARDLTDTDLATVLSGMPLLKCLSVACSQQVGKQSIRQCLGLGSGGCHDNDAEEKHAGCPLLEALDLRYTDIRPADLLLLSQATVLPRLSKLWWFQKQHSNWSGEDIVGPPGMWLPHSGAFQEKAEQPRSRITCRSLRAAADAMKKLRPSVDVRRVSVHASVGARKRALRLSIMHDVFH